MSNDLRVVDITGNEVVYHRLKRAFGAVHRITEEDALKYLGYGHKQIIINAEDLPKGLPIPR